MSSFDAERGVMILEPEQWDVLQRMVTGPIAQRANYAQGALAGLEDIGVIDPYGPTLAASRVLAGLMAADARYSLRRMDPKDPVPVRDIVLWLSSSRCTVERYDSDGVHVYGCDDVEVPHIAPGNTIFTPVPWLMTAPTTSMTRWPLRCVWRMFGPLRPAWALSVIAGRGPLSSCRTLVTGGGRSCFTVGRTGTGIRGLS